MLTLFELYRIIKLIDEYCNIMGYAISSKADWVDILYTKNDVRCLKRIKAKLEEEYDKQNKMMVRVSYE